MSHLWLAAQNRTGFPADPPYRFHPVEIHVLTSSWKEHRLLDSGDGLKLEEFAGVRIIRSEPKAWWHKILPAREWSAAVATHEESGRDGRWRLTGAAPKEWEARFENIRLNLRFMDNSKQIGVFPEQSPHWEWLSKSRPPEPGQSKLLNLFGYTGAASLVAANAGWLVTHVDASKPAIAWGKRNQQLSNMTELPIRWILEDAMTFVKREAKRGNRYDAILLDPPAFGRGPNGEFWKVERDLMPLLEACREILSAQACLLLLTIYTIDASSILCHNLLSEVTGGLGGAITIGELALRQSKAERPLPLSLWGRWERRPKS
jgi:23S rRNA (cytosine1962-C5)-methyltransferase